MASVELEWRGNTLCVPPVILWTIIQEGFVKLVILGEGVRCLKRTIVTPELSVVSDKKRVLHKLVLPLCILDPAQNFIGLGT